MTLLDILKLVGAVATALTGLIAVVRAKHLEDFTGLIASTPRATTEIRAVIGGGFLALGVAPIVFNSPDMYLMLGIVYLALAVVRGGSMIFDGSFNHQGNQISLALEVVFGIILVL